jgi:O-antigen/teichoic acid export membrane protein
MKIEMNRNLTFQAAVITFGKVVVSASTILLGMLLSRHLSVEGYGTYRQVWLVYNLFYPVFTTGIANSVNYFLPRLNRERQKVFLNQTYFLLFLLGLVFSLILFLGAERISLYFHNPALKSCLVIFSPIPLLSLSTSFYQNYFICLGKPVLASGLSIATSLFRFALVFLAISRQSSLINIFQVTTIYSALEFGIISWFLFRESRGIRGQGEGILGEQLKFAFPISLSSVAGSLTKQTDKLIISSCFSTPLYAVYANGAIELPIVHILTGSVMAVLMPEFVRVLQQGESLRVIHLWHKSIKHLGLIFLPSMVFLYAFSDQVISILFSAKYLASVPVFRVYLFTLPVRVTIFSSLLLALGRPKSVLRYSVYTLITNLILSVILVKPFGFLGPAWATVLVLYLMDFLQLREIAQQLKIKLSQAFPWREQLKILGLSLLCLPIPLWVGTLFRRDWSIFLGAGFSFLFCYGVGVVLSGLVSRQRILFDFRRVVQTCGSLLIRRNEAFPAQEQSVNKNFVAGFKYDFSNDRLICPKGKKSALGIIFPDLNGYVFRFAKQHCSDCVYRFLCQSSPQGKVYFVHSYLLRQWSEEGRRERSSD